MGGWCVWGWVGGWVGVGGGGGGGAGGAARRALVVSLDGCHTGLMLGALCLRLAAACGLAWGWPVGGHLPHDNLYAERPLHDRRMTAAPPPHSSPPPRPAPPPPRAGHPHHILWHTGPVCCCDCPCSPAHQVSAGQPGMLHAHSAVVALLPLGSCSYVTTHISVAHKILICVAHPCKKSVSQSPHHPPPPAAPHPPPTPTSPQNQPTACPNVRTRIARTHTRTHARTLAKDPPAGPTSWAFSTCTPCPTERHSRSSRRCRQEGATPPPPQCFLYPPPPPPPPLARAVAGWPAHLLTNSPLSSPPQPPPFPLQVVLGSLAIVAGLATGGSLINTNVQGWAVIGSYEVARLLLVAGFIMLHRRENIAKP